MIHDSSRGTYGVPRVHAELAADGVQIGRKRMARLMRQAALQGVSRRRSQRTTRRGRNPQVVPDLVNRDFTADAPDKLWVADITYISTWSGFLYLAIVLDTFSRRVVGWSMATHLRTELVLEALNMAIWQRNPQSVIHHSDQGTQPEFKGSSQQWLTSYLSQACCMGFFSLQTSRRRGCAELWGTRPRVVQGLVGIA